MPGDTFLSDFLDGKYPDYNIDLFANDLVTSILMSAQEKSLQSISFNPSLAQHESFVTIRTLLTSRMPNIEIVEDADVSLEEVWRPAWTELADQNLASFQEFIQTYGLSCTEEDYRVIKLFEFYQAFSQKS